MASTLARNARGLGFKTALRKTLSIFHDTNYKLIMDVSHLRRGSFYALAFAVALRRRIGSVAV